MATLRAATTNGTSTLNSISGKLTEPVTYQREGRVEREKDWKLSRLLMTLLTANKQVNAKQTMRRPH